MIFMNIHTGEICLLHNLSFAYFDKDGTIALEGSKGKDVYVKETEREDYKFIGWF